ncbi:acylphosphatase [Halobacillus yeomjeoni]|uniref:Acylphosphatase n=1 Tax=Halobacillus yeomjeoni TaxID=311194 RepID=A0A931HUL4_9BACI|nr:acylphosphatase [Halobacillus yeomjeoni]MBH0229496.1 acylphosphatase [Halobacillus yeomjeoni]
MARKHMIVHGRVQGVGFRATAKQIADQLNIQGWVKNKSDGTVEIDAEGESDHLSHFIDQLNQGPSPFAKVSAIDITESETEKGYKKFKIVE